MNEKLRLLGSTVDEMYEVISFPEGGEPDWVQMAAVFHPEARLTRVTPEGVDSFTLASFQKMCMEMLDRGVYTSFFESEIARRIDVFGSIAHVLSAYETKGRREAVSPLARGINSIQLLWDAPSWRVLNLFWDEETNGNPIDVPKLFEERASRA